MLSRSQLVSFWPGCVSGGRGFGIDRPLHAVPIQPRLEAANRDSALNAGQTVLAARELTIGAAGLYADLAASLYWIAWDRSVEEGFPIPNNAIYSWGARR